MSRAPRPGIMPVVTTVVDGDGARAVAQELTVEEPLEIRVAGERVTTTMRTPGQDRFLALGFLFAEGIIADLSDVGSVYHCGRTDDPHYGSAIDVLPGPGARLDPERVTRSQRAAPASSACGQCGRASIDDLLARSAPRTPCPACFEAALLHRLPALLRAHQPEFERTGGLHAACAVSASGAVLAHAEDVGRHNAVDKVVGMLLYAQDLRHDPPRLLAVSGRASFEIVQKAAVAGFACIASVSAPSSLAVRTADALGITLAGFVREGRFTLYTHAEQVRP